MIILYGRLCLAAFLSAFLLVFTLTAQDLDDVTLTGRVADPNGLAIVGATVKAIQIETRYERTVTTNEDCRFRLSELKPGAYKLIVSQSGFGLKEKSALQTVSGQNVQIDFQLSPAGVTGAATVTVSEEDTSPVDTTRTIVGGTISARELEEIPNSSRNPL